jgi:hypothetical protein
MCERLIGLEQNDIITNSIKVEIDALLEKKAEGFKIRAKANLIKDADKTTRFFLAKETTRGYKKEIIKTEIKGKIVQRMKK